MEEVLVVGRTVPMMSQDGRVVQGVVREVLDDAVRMDFNHPMAGKTLNFTGKVIEVRDATEKELKEGLHGEYLPPEEHHCKHHGDGECCHGEGHKDGECCHGEGHKDGECCHGEGEKDGKCCHGKEKE
jgi:FKBP-type peptidyl-prolyl cis-trans isomerase SlyD